MNEIIVLVASYHLFCFTEWVYDLNVRFQVGWSMLVFLVINVATNITIMLCVVFKQAIQKIKVMYFTRGKKRILEENKRIREERERNQFEFRIEARTTNFLR